jgi:MinD-like ATPase involved in chromosome partitioning or flagellar assembly
VNTNGNDNPRWWRPTGPDRVNGDGLAAYRRIALQLHRDLLLPVDRSALLTSPTESPLCARGSVTLASCLAEELQQRILLIDASPRTREASRMLGCEESPGFLDFLSEPSLPLESLALATSHPNLWFLAAGSRGRNGLPTAHPAIEMLQKSAGRQYDFILLAAGPVLTDSMALALAPYVGVTLMLVIENESTVEELDSAQAALNMCKARKIGLVLTTQVRGRKPFKGSNFLGS